LNGHPDEEQSQIELGRRVAVFGEGNVAIDIIRLLTCAPESLVGSDIDDGVHGPMRESLARIHIIGRSASQEAKFDPVMIRELARVPGLPQIGRASYREE